MPTIEIREYVNAVQDTVDNHDAGSFIESLWDAAEHYGSGRPACSPARAASGARRRCGRWSMAEVRRELDAGRPIVPQVWYRGLPGREERPYNGDHYVVLTGYTAEVVLYNDPIDKDGPGREPSHHLGPAR